MKEKRLRKFMNEHKPAFELVGAGALVILLIALGVKWKPAKKTTLATEVNKQLRKRIQDIPIPENFSVGELGYLWEEGGCLNTIADKLTVEDLGRFGEEMVKHGLALKEASASIVLATKN